MATLKNIRTRKKSVQSTKKITAAMKLIAAAKLRKAQEHALASRPYAELIAHMLDNLLQSQLTFDHVLPLMTGNGKAQRHLFVILTSDRGLCGGFNGAVIHRLHAELKGLDKQNKSYEFLCIGRKGSELLTANRFKTNIIDTLNSPDHARFIQAKRLATRLEEMFNQDQFDICSLVYTQFISAIHQKVVVRQLVPFERQEAEGPTQKLLQGFYEYEPNERQVLEGLLVKNLTVQIYRALLENTASENAARMTAMDAATRNASDMIKALDLQYNRTRQALVTRELIEIISGAEAL
ncbi:MAG: F0F1 ATP synthase subunit gamma [Alphaproteobacteria bacterium]|nr:F0F1 ATP synthase subunit gamma [Alphaproteobacteria bacterium]